MTTSNLILNVEADEIIYRAAFASQKTHYTVTTKKGNRYDFGPRYTKREITALYSKRRLVEGADYVLEKYLDVEPVSHALRTAKSIVNRLARLGEVNLWLSPSDRSNFRYNIAKTPGPAGKGYKAGRPERPQHYADVRNYLIERFGAEEIKGYEADDALGIYQTDNSVAVHIDKDINMIAGKHLNWVTMERYVVAEGLGEYPHGKIFFWHQMLTGDRTDNIPGIPKIGPVKSQKILNQCKTEAECFMKVRDIYENHYGANGLEILKEVANLLWICPAKEYYGENYIQKFLD